MYSFLSYFTALSILAPIVLLITKRKILDTALRIFSFFVGLSFFADLIGFIFYMQGTSTVLLFKIYTILEGVLLFVFFAAVFRKPYRKVFILTFLPVFLLSAVIAESYDFKLSMLDAVECTLLLICSAVFFYDVIFLRFQIVQKECNYVYAINAAIFLYFGTNLGLFAFEETVRYSSPIFGIISWSIHHISHIIFNVLISVGIARKR